MSTTNLRKERLRTVLASILQTFWERWMKYLLLETAITKKDGSVRIPAVLCSRWKRQMTTNYENLSAEEQERALGQADDVIAVLYEHTKTRDSKDMLDYLGKLFDFGIEGSVISQVVTLQREVYMLKQYIEELETKQYPEETRLKAEQETTVVKTVIEGLIAVHELDLVELREKNAEMKQKLEAAKQALALCACTEKVISHYEQELQELFDKITELNKENYDLKEQVAELKLRNDIGLWIDFYQRTHNTRIFSDKEREQIAELLHKVWSNWFVVFMSYFAEPTESGDFLIKAKDKHTMDSYTVKDFSELPAILIMNYKQYANEITQLWSENNE